VPVLWLSDYEQCSLGLLHGPGLVTVSQIQKRLRDDMHYQGGEGPLSIDVGCLGHT